MQDDFHEGMHEERVQFVVCEAYAERAAQVWHVAERTEQRQNREPFG